MKKNNLLDDIIKNLPLENRIRVNNQMAFITLLTDLGFREEKSWGDEEDELLSKLMSLAEAHTESILETFKEWEKDGRPI